MNPSDSKTSSSEKQPFSSLSTPYKTFDNFHINSASSKKDQTQSPPDLTPREVGRAAKLGRPIGRLRKPNKAKVVNAIKANLKPHRFEYLLANKKELLKLEAEFSYSKAKEGETFVQLLRLRSLPKLPINKWEAACLGTSTGVFKLLGYKPKRASSTTFKDDPLRMAIYKLTKTSEDQALDSHISQVQAPKKATLVKLSTILNQIHEVDAQVEEQEGLGPLPFSTHHSDSESFSEEASEGQEELEYAEPRKVYGLKERRQMKEERPDEENKEARKKTGFVTASKSITPKREKEKRNLSEVILDEEDETFEAYGSQTFSEFFRFGRKKAEKENMEEEK